MPFNVSKYNVMHIGRKNTKNIYTVMGQEIPETIEEKDLGAVFSGVIGLIRRSIINQNAEEMKILYKTLVRPILDYYIPVWRPLSE